MAKDDILGGLQVALERGASLEGAMRSFYNAGYKKEEIEEAAKVLMTRAQPQQFQSSEDMQKTQPQKKYQQFKSGKSVQKVSDYEKPSGVRTIAIAVLVTLLLILLGALAGIFIFKEEIIGLFGKILG